MPEHDVDHRRLHERRERIEGHAGRRREPLDLPEQRDEVVRGDDRGGVILHALAVGQVERLQPERAGELGGLRIARNRRPRAVQPLEADRRGRKRLQRMERSDAHVGAELLERGERVETT